MRIRSGHTVVRAAAALAALALAIEGAAAQAPAPLANAGFEEGAPGALPPGWGGPAAASTPGGNPASAYRALVDADNPSEGRASARLERSGAGGSSPFGALSQAVDAMPYRGRRVRLTAAVRAGAAQTAQVGLWLRVDREGGRLGFFDNMNDRPITGTQWAEYTIEGDVSARLEASYDLLILSRRADSTGRVVPLTASSYHLKNSLRPIRNSPRASWTSLNCMASWAASCRPSAFTMFSAASTRP